MDTKQIIFKIGNEQYGIDILKVHEIENANNIVPVPNSQECVLGIMHLRDSVIPIYSLRRKFNMDDYEITQKDEEPQKLIIAASKDMEIGFLVDRVEEIMEIKDSQIFNTPRIVRNEDTAYIDRVACVNKKIIILLNFDAIVSDEEMEDIAVMVEDM